MSHRATNWAFEQSGLKPATKLVLLHLADRHNPDHGCFPSQDRLAVDCEMSRASINVHLAALEEAGLIQRVQRVDPETRRQLPTRYLFAFEAEFDRRVKTKADPEQLDLGIASGRAVPAQPTLSGVQSESPCLESGHGAAVGTVSRNQGEPCPEIGASRVQILDTNHVREPLREPVVFSASEAAKMAEAFERYWQEHPRPRDREKTERLFREAVGSGVNPDWVTRAATKYARENAKNKRMYLVYSDNWLRDKRWHDYPECADGVKLPVATSDADPLAATARFMAEKIKGKAYVAPSAVSSTMARYMVERGLVSSADLREVGVHV